MGMYTEGVGEGVGGWEEVSFAADTSDPQQGWLCVPNLGGKEVRLAVGTGEP